MEISAYFSIRGTPAAGLDVSVLIYDLTTGSSSILSGFMTEIGSGFYRVDFTDYEPTHDYAILCYCENVTFGLSGRERYSIAVHGEGNIIVAYFFNNGNKGTGLSPTLKVYNLTDSQWDIDGAVMTEVGNGFYKTSFSGYDSEKDYLVLADGGSGLSGYDRYSIGFNWVDVEQILIEGFNVDPLLVDGTLRASVVTSEEHNVEASITPIAITPSVVNDIADIGVTVPNAININVEVE